MNQPPVLIERHGHTMVITLNRPEARNAVNRAVAEAVGSALEEAESDRSVWAVVITGAGDAAFCAGADLKAISLGEPLVPKGKEHWSFAGWANHFVSKPTIAAVNGFALGGGMEIVLASDLAVASANAQFGLPETKRGLIAAAGGAFRVIEQLPRKVGMHMLVTGEPITATAACAYGLVNEVVPEGKSLEAALSVAELICRNAPTAVQASKRIAYGATAMGWSGEQTRWEQTRIEGVVVRGSADSKEGPRAFAEKRAPIWQGA